MEKVFSCELCTKKFISRDELNAHASEPAALPKRPLKKFKCDLCRYECSKNRDFIRHTRTHTGERPFKCTSDDCEMAFTLESTLKNHIKRKHSDERPFECNFSDCTFTAKTSANLIAHKMRVHSGRRDFKCGHPQCTKSFKSSVELKLHFSNRHEKRNVPCDHPGCDKLYANVQALKIHKRDVHSKKTLVCPTVTCSYRTNKASRLAYHMIVHDVGKEKISCSIVGCLYQGKNTLALKKHMRLHKTLLLCPVAGCDRYARTKKALENHVKLHNSSERPFQCPLCFKYYATLKNLQSHCFAHTNEKPFACGLCDYAASFRSYVKTHISLVHGGIRFPFIVHLLDERECLDCKVTLSTEQFLIHCKGHAEPVV